MINQVQRTKEGEPDDRLAVTPVVTVGRTDFDLNHQLGKQGSPTYWKEFFVNSGVDHGVAQSYKNPDGVYIRTNPETGYKEMFVRGTTFKHFGYEWFQNTTEGAMRLFEKAANFMNVNEHNVKSAEHLVNNIRDNYSDYVEHLAESNNVDVIYGHSRGGAVISKLDGEKYKLIGLDAATAIGYENSDLLNIRANQIFDKGIGLGHKNEVVVKGVPFHAVFGNEGKAEKATEASLQRKRPKKKFIERIKEREKAMKKKRDRRSRLKKKGRFPFNNRRNKRYNKSRFSGNKQR